MMHQVGAAATATAHKLLIKAYLGVSEPEMFILRRGILYPLPWFVHLESILPTVSPSFVRESRLTGKEPKYRTNE